MWHCDTVPLQTAETLDPCRASPRRQRGSWTTQCPVAPFLLRELEIGPSARHFLHPIASWDVPSLQLSTSKTKPQFGGTRKPYFSHNHHPPYRLHLNTSPQIPSIDAQHGRKQRQSDWYRKFAEPAPQDRGKERRGLYYYGQSTRGGMPEAHKASLTSPSQVAGESGLGKTTFINTLFSTTIKNYADHKRRHQKQVDKTVEIEITKAELEEKFFKGRSRTSCWITEQSID